MIPYVRDIDIVYGRSDQASPLIRRVTANNPGPFTFKGTGTYIVGHGKVAVVDPGPDMQEHVDAEADVGEPVRPSGRRPPSGLIACALHALRRRATCCAP